MRRTVPSFSNATLNREVSLRPFEGLIKNIHGAIVCCYGEASVDSILGLHSGRFSSLFVVGGSLLVVGDG